MTKTLSKTARAAWLAGYQEALADVMQAATEHGDLRGAVVWCRDNGTEATRHAAEAWL